MTSRCGRSWPAWSVSISRNERNGQMVLRSSVLNALGRRQSGAVPGHDRHSTFHQPLKLAIAPEPGPGGIYPEQW